MERPAKSHIDFISLMLKSAGVIRLCWTDLEPNVVLPVSNGQDDPGQWGGLLPSLREAGLYGSSRISPAALQLILPLPGKSIQGSLSK